jgi:hypothetical protein
VKLSNVPIVNLRSEFGVHYRLAKAHKLLPPNGMPPRPFSTPYLTWKSMPDMGATLLFVRTLLSLETYMSFAAEFGGAMRGCLTADFRKACRNPFTLGRGGTAHCYFNKLPALIDPVLALSKHSPATWARTKALYTEVRNPLFHGHELSELKHDQFARLFEQVADTYRYIDSWYDPEDVLKGARKAFALD